MRARPSAPGAGVPEEGETGAGDVVGVVVPGETSGVVAGRVSVAVGVGVVVRVLASVVEEVEEADEEEDGEDGEDVVRDVDVIAGSVSESADVGVRSPVVSIGPQAVARMAVPQSAATSGMRFMSEPFRFSRSVGRCRSR